MVKCFFKKRWEMGLVGYRYLIYFDNYDENNYSIFIYSEKRHLFKTKIISVYIIPLVISK